LDLKIPAIGRLIGTYRAPDGPFASFAQQSVQMFAQINALKNKHIF